MFSGKIEDYILFEDKEIIVCRKPAGIAVQNARIGAMDLESSLKNYLAMQDGGGRRIPYLAVIHRLDQPVEGILVFGKTPEAANTPGAKKARLSYEVLGEAVDEISGKKKWLLRIHLDTGRHHQIRVQMAHAGMPLAGDRKYGAGTNVTIGAGSLALCAASLTFFHPVTGKVMKFVTKPEGAEFKGISIPQM